MNNGIFLLLGTNVGNRASNLDKAKQAINRFGKIISMSAVYQTEPWGKADQAPFYNQVVEISTVLDPIDLLDSILAIETELGRVREEKWGPRLIDIDILFYGDFVLESKDLVIPHPGTPVRRFVLLPLCEIAPRFIHPLFSKDILTLLKECNDPLNVEKLKF